MPVELPPTTVTAAQLKAKLNIKTDDDAADVLAIADAECRRAFADAFREVPAPIWDDCVTRVAGAVVGARRRPAGGQGQLSTAEQNEPVRAPRDYTAPIRAELAVYVLPGMA